MNNTDFISVYFMGEKDLALMSFNLFEQDIHENFPKLDLYFSNASCLEYAKLLHKWKPNFKMFGNPQLSEKVSDLEKELKDNLEMLNLERHEFLKTQITMGIKQIKQNII